MFARSENLLILFGAIVSFSAHASFLEPASFPKTISDLPFVQRQQVFADGYAPYADMDPYVQFNIAEEIKSLEETRAQDAANMSYSEYCDKYPLDDLCNPTPDTENAVIAIGDAESNTVSGDNHTHNGPCTPSERSNVYTNRILTTGKYETIDPAFEKAMVQIFRAEGKCGAHPNDPGGYTCYGFSQKSNPDIDVSKLTRAGAEKRTYDRFYIKKGIDRLPDAIRGDVLRGDFGSGPGNGVRILQKTLGLKQTGNIDDALIRACENYDGDLHNAFWDTRQKFLVQLTKQRPSSKVFLKGWMNGVRLFRDNGCHVVPKHPIYRTGTKQ